MKAKTVFHSSLGTHHPDHYILIFGASRIFIVTRESSGIHSGFVLAVHSQPLLPTLTLTPTNNTQHPWIPVPCIPTEIALCKGFGKTDYRQSINHF